MQQLDLSGSLSILFPILLIVIFVVLIIVPNRRRDKKFKDMLASVKVGDRIKTIGGIYGKIVQLKEDLIVIETGPDKAQLQMAKNSIATIENYDVESESAKDKDTK
jgi:preprotein translocase subunit YajC